MISAINSIPEFKFTTNKFAHTQSIDELAFQLGKNTQLPDEKRLYPIFNNELVKNIAAEREKAIPVLKKVLKNTNDEKTVCETLYTIDRMIEANVGGIKGMYPEISRFNNTNSPNIQVLLAGIYRKTQIPDGFGPLMKMLIKNSIREPNCSFDPTEEIGGAILDYLRAKGAVHFYSQNS